MLPNWVVFSSFWRSFQFPITFFLWSCPTYSISIWPNISERYRYLQFVCVLHYYSIVMIWSSSIDHCFFLFFSSLFVCCILIELIKCFIERDWFCGPWCQTFEIAPVMKGWRNRLSCLKSYSLFHMELVELSKPCFLAFEISFLNHFFYRRRYSGWCHC